MNGFSGGEAGLNCVAPAHALSRPFSIEGLEGPRATQANAGHASTRIRSGCRVSQKRPGRVWGETGEKHLNTCLKRMFRFFPSCLPSVSIGLMPARLITPAAFPNIPLLSK